MTRPPNNPKPPAQRWLWWLAAAAALIVVLAAGAMAWYYLADTQVVWTDGRGTVIPDKAANLRRVLWSQPRAPAGPVNSPQHDYEPGPSADGREMFFVRGLPGRNADIYFTRLQRGRWTQPAPLAAVNTDHDELGPRLTADGRFLLFYSDRPGGVGQYDIWAVERTAAGWGEPFDLGPSVNSPYNDYGPAMTPDGGRLIFSSNRKAAQAAGDKAPWRATVRQGDLNDYDLFVAERVAGGTTTAPSSKASAAAPPEGAYAAAPSTAPSLTSPVRSAPLAFREARELEGINTPYREGVCCVSPAGDFLYFASNRTGGMGGFDIYRCRLTDGRCGPVENLGPEINTPYDDMDPATAGEGFVLVFSSDRPGSAGGYDLFETTSREVFASYRRREAPRLSWGVWALLAALAVLIPLLLFLRAAGYRHLNLLTKCVIISLLAHVLLTMLLGLFWISQPILHRVAEAAGLTTAVNLDAAREVEIRMAIRQQVSDLPVNELPVADPTLAQLVRRQPEAIERVEPDRTELNVPRAPVRPAPLTVQPEAPRAIRPAPAETVSLPAPPLVAEAPRIQLARETPLARQADEAPEVTTPAPPPAEPTPARLETPAPAPAAVAAEAVPVKPELASLAELAVAEQPAAPQTETVAPRPVALRQVQPTVTLPKVTVTAPVAETPATAPAIPAAVETVRTPMPTAGPRGQSPPTAALAVPAVQAVGNSLAVAAEVTRAPAPQAAPVAIDIAAASDAPAIKLPVLASGPPEAEPVPLAASVQPPGELEPRPLVGLKARAQPRSSDAAAAVTPARATATSLVRPAAASVGRPTALEATTARLEIASVITPLAPLAAPGIPASPETLFQRSFEQRKKFVDAFGGSEQSEQAVARALAWMARRQQGDGRWAFAGSESGGGRRGKNDVAVTALASLCFLGADHTPDKQGPYQQCISKALDYILASEGADGDLRGGGDMYSQAIATLALAEAAIMTRQPRYREAAFKAGRFILRAQNTTTGGWRYNPGDPGDTSVLGWQVMALHSLRQVGFTVPEETRKGCFRWLARVSRSPHGMLAGYTDPTPRRAMTAEALFCRAMLGQKLTAEQIDEACEYITYPGEIDRMYYYWYYGALALMQFQNDAWRQWYPRVRDALVSYQERDGSWDERRSQRYGPRGGKLYATALSTLTLEVTYRYLPMYARPASR